MLNRRTLIASTALMALPLKAQPKKFTDKLVKIVVPFAAGGGVDIYARLLAEKLRTALGYSIIVENKAGASGTIGGGSVKDAEADGTTLLFSAGTHVMAQHVLKAAPYNPIDDFASIAKVGDAPMMLVMSPKVEAKNLQEMIAEAKKNPDNWAFATAALGAPGHIATIAFMQAVGLNLKVVPYRGTAPALNDVAGGHIQLLIDPVLALLPMATGGQVKGLAVTASKRSKLASTIPSLAEGGIANFDQSSWYGVWGPKSMSPALISEINAAFNFAVNELEKEGKLATIGIEPFTGTPSAFQEFAKSYANTSGGLLKAAKFEPM